MRCFNLILCGLRVAAISVLTAACAQIPEIDRVVHDSVAQAPYPEILPVSQTLVLDNPRLSDSSEDDLDARARRLRRRAADLQ